LSRPVWYTSPVPRIRPVRPAVLALPAAIVAAFAFTLPTAGPIAQVSEVQGAVGEPVAPVASVGPPPVDSRLVYGHATDRDGPMAARERIPPPIASLRGYVWPLTRGRITLPFKAIPGGTRINDGKLFHDGVDMATFCGDTVRAAHDGVVLAAGRHFDDLMGWVGDLSLYYRTLDARHLWDDLPNVVVTDDGNGYRSMYAHMSSVTVRVGETIEAGQRIGYEGRTGHASGCHVHYGLYSPLERKTFGVRADIVKRLHTPPLEIARIDPLLVLPGGAEALKTRHVPSPTKPGASPAPAPAAEPLNGE
jgi:murein DD-endopeptidase MepM/ murein hydrolase activator NlpD